MTNTTNINTFRDCMKALEARITRDNFLRSVCFDEPSEACEWATNNAHAPFTAFIEDGRAVLIQPAPYDHWFWSEDRCPVSSRPTRPTQRPIGSIIQDIYAGVAPVELGTHLGTLTVEPIYDAAK